MRSGCSVNVDGWTSPRRVGVWVGLHTAPRIQTPRQPRATEANMRLLPKWLDTLSAPFRTIDQSLCKLKPKPVKVCSCVSPRLSSGCAAFLLVVGSLGHHHGNHGFEIDGCKRMFRIATAAAIHNVRTIKKHSIFTLSWIQTFKQFKRFIS